MAWLTKGNGQYYYRSRREGQRVISEYMGAGYGAELMAQLDAHERDQAELQRLQWQAVKDEQDAIDAQIDAIGAQLYQLVDAHLLVAGYRQHKRQWRKKRGKESG